MEPDSITIRGAREHNLKGIDVVIPKRKLVVLSGPSGSGKTSLAFDTLYAEGQRRYVESLSSYARQFLGQLRKPRYDTIRGLSPTIAIEQKAASSNPRSTVGTITEVSDYLRVWYARLGQQRCPSCGEIVEKSSAEAIVHVLEKLAAGTRYLLLAPVLENRKGEFKEALASLRREGLVRARIDGEVKDLADFESLAKRKKHTVEAVIDRLVAGQAERRRLTDSVETALRLGQGRLVIAIAPRSGEPTAPDRILSERLACERCGIAFPELSPQRFSFNSPLGMCVECNGLGTALDIDKDLLCPDPSRSISEGALRPWSSVDADEGRGFGNDVVRALAEVYEIDLDCPFRDLSRKQKDVIFYGSGKTKIPVRWERGRSQGVHYMAFEGLVPAYKRRLLQTQSEEMKRYYSQFLVKKACETCTGTRLNEASRHVVFRGKSIVDLHELSIQDLRAFFDGLDLNATEHTIAQDLVKEIRARLRFLVDVGLGYLKLGRNGPTLSGGEAQRIRLASQIGTELTGVIYVLDEPSIGLHQRDNQKLLRSLEHLRDLGNTVVVIEHDLETLERCDHLIDFGPGAGVRGGEVVAAGTPAEVKEDERSITGAYLAGRLQIPLPERIREPSEVWIEVLGAAANNLRNIDVRIPVGLLTCVTGVSGAGKSSLVNQILLPALYRALGGTADVPGRHREIRGLDAIDKVIAIDQQPIGRTPRSNPATYTKLFDPIRTLFAALPASKMYGYLPGRFSFNVKGGRCEACAGDGVRKVEMHFLADVYVTCEECDGRRFNEATLDVKYRGHSIADVLAKTVAEAVELFKDHPDIKRVLATLVDVGLDYLPLGQSSTTLSGGEAQRIKLSRELAKRSTGRTLYVLDEPSTGLHFDDVKKLLAVLQRLVDAGNTVLVIEHNLDIIKVADWIIDLGPEGGDAGGHVLVAGPPAVVAACAESHTGRHLQDMLARHATREREVVGVG